MIPQIQKNKTRYYECLSKGAYRDQETEVAGTLIPPGSRYKCGKRHIWNGPRWVVRVKCPWCGKFHYHGWDPADTWPATRHSHCKVPGVDRAGYTIITPPRYSVCGGM